VWIQRTSETVHNCTFSSCVHAWIEYSAFRKDSAYDLGLIGAGRELAQEQAKLTGITEITVAFELAGLAESA
jgi:hypothetical protein